MKQKIGNTARFIRNRALPSFCPIECGSLELTLIFNSSNHFLVGQKQRLAFEGECGLEVSPTLAALVQKVVLARAQVESFDSHMYQSHVAISDEFVSF
jgi:hypothetical protein